MSLTQRIIATMIVVVMVLFTITPTISLATEEILQNGTTESVLYQAENTIEPKTEKIEEVQNELENSQIVEDKNLVENTNVVSNPILAQTPHLENTNTQQAGENIAVHE